MAALIDNGIYILRDGGIKTIAAGVLTINDNGFFQVAAQTGVADDLDTINYSVTGITAEAVVILQPDTGDTITLKDGTGNISLKGGDLALADDEQIMLGFDGTTWYDLGGGGGGGAASPLTTKGDIWGYAATDARIPIGSNGQILTADSAQALGLKWAANAGIDPSTALGGNLVYNYPALDDAADGAQPEWWEESGSGTLTEEDAAGEGIAEKYERVLKFVVSAGGGGTDYVYQQYDVSAEPTLDESVTTISAGVWIYVVTSGVVTMDLRDTVGGSLGTTDATTTTDAWEFLKIEGETLGANDLELRFTGDTNSMTFYIAMPALNVGPFVQPWEPRRLRFINKFVDLVLSENPADTNWADLDFTANTSPITAALAIKTLLYATIVAAGYIRPNGSSQGQDGSTRSANSAGANLYGNSVIAFQLCDDGQIIEESVSSTNVTVWQIAMYGYWEWE